MEDLPKKKVRRARKNTIHVPITVTGAVSTSFKKTKAQPAATVRNLKAEALELKRLMQNMRAEVEPSSGANPKKILAMNSRPVKGYHSLEVKTEANPHSEGETSDRHYVKAAKRKKSDPQKQNIFTDHASLPPKGEVVTLPNAVSERLVSKRKALAAWYKIRFSEYAARASYVAGFIFVVLAVSVLGVQASTQYSSWGDFQQAALCAALPCTASSTSTLINELGSSSASTTLAIPVSSIKFRTTPPSPLWDNFDAIVRAENVTDVAVYIESRVTSLTKQLSAAPESSGDDKRYLIDPKLLAVGEYQLRATGRGVVDSKIINVTGPRFTIEQKEAVVSTVSSTGTTSSTSVGLARTSEASTTPKVITPSTASTTTATTTTPILDTTSRVSFTVTATEDERFIAKLSLEGAASVEVFAQRAQASEPFFIGHAKKFDGNYWHYSFLSSSLPNGSYSIFARAKLLTGAIQQSDRRSIFIATTQPTVLSPVTTIEPVAPARTTASGTALLTDVVPQSAPKPPIGISLEAPRTNYLVPLSVDEDRSQPASVEANDGNESDAVVENFVNAQLADNSSRVNDLLVRYASAYQTRDKSLITLAREQLKITKEELSQAALSDPKASAQAFLIESRLSEEFAALEERVEKIESLIENRTSDAGTKDSDGDGISDNDETVLYNTDPQNSDSDGDGVNDGAEITGGYNPSDATAESMMRFSSPKDFGLTREDILQVSSILPIIETDLTRGTPKIQAEIRGKGLPNSFVTIFIYSTPVVVTVKTDADGSFVYEFDRELEDGNHEVYVAVTDNTGDVIAKSNPFRFIKEAEAFTAVNNENTYVTTESGDSSTTYNVFNTVAALVVLTFGLILMIIGLVLRREQPIVSSTKETVLV